MTKGQVCMRIYKALKNCVLNLLQDGLYDLDVDGASTLRLENATITTGATFQATWSAFLDVTILNSNLFMDDHSALAFPGTLVVTNSLVCVNDSGPRHNRHTGSARTNQGEMERNRQK